MVESTGHFDEPQEWKQERVQQLCSADQIVDVPLLHEFEGPAELEKAAIRARIPQEVLETNLELRATGSANRVSLR